MTNTNDFRQALQFTLLHEVGSAPNGGYTNDPNDPGGETKWGITKRFHPNLDIQNLTPEQAMQIYSSEYWDGCGCDQIPFPFNVVVFDTAVNPGIGLAKKWLKSSPDVKTYLGYRKQYYYQVVAANSAMRAYLVGWLTRVADLQKFADIATASQDQQARLDQPCSQGSAKLNPTKSDNEPRWGSLG